MQRLMNAASAIIFDFRCDVGLWLLAKAMRWMPSHYSVLEGISRGMREQKMYDRYAAFARILGDQPLPFSRWRQTYQWIKTRPVEKCRVRDRYRKFIVREGELAPL